MSVLKFTQIQFPDLLSHTCVVCCDADLECLWLFLRLRLLLRLEVDHFLSFPSIPLLTSFSSEFHARSKRAMVSERSFVFLSQFVGNLLIKLHFAPRFLFSDDRAFCLSSLLRVQIFSSTFPNRTSRRYLRETTRAVVRNSVHDTT